MNSPQPRTSHAAVPQTMLLALFALVALTANHLMLSALGTFGFIWIVVFAAATFYLMPAVALTTLVLSLLFQNTLLCLLVGQVDDAQTFQTIQGTSFIVTLMLGALAIFTLMRHRALMNAEQRKLMTVGILFMLTVFFYLLLGMLHVSPASALSYGRLYFNGPLLFAAGLWLCWLTPPSTIRTLLAVCAAAQIVWGVWELLSAYTLYDGFNVNQFLAFKFAARPEASNFDSIKEVIDRNTRSYLNLSGAFGLDIQMLRLKGPTLHAIAYGYTLAFFGLVMFMLRRTVLAFACIALLVLVGAKGPLLMVLASLVLYAVYHVLHKNASLLKTLLLAFAGLYVTVGLVYGFQTSDYHVIGFVGGVKGFMANPVGHGVGVGGNLSDQSFAGRDLVAFQQFGADYALESALGVMLYQLGIATLVFFWFYLRLWRTVWNHALAHNTTSPRLIILPLALGLLLVNTIFQEEALSPAGWGLWLFWSGIVLGWARKDVGNQPADASTSSAR